MKLSVCLILFNLVIFKYISAQQVFYQDICHCGVTGGGFSTGLGAGSGNLHIYIEPGSIIKKAILFAQRIGKPEAVNITLNGNNYNFNEYNQVSTNFNVPNLQNFSAVHAIEITNEIDPNQLNYSISIPVQMNDNVTDVYGSIYLYIVYENFNLLPSSQAIFMNNYSMNQEITNYSAQNLNPIITNLSVGFSLYTDRINSPSSTTDGSYLFVNGNGAGLTGGGCIGVDDSWNSGSRGHFYYQNNQLFGLSGNQPNNAVGENDGIADISSYLANFNNNFDWSLNWQSPNRFNIYSGFFLTYTSPCDTFTTSLTPDTTICFGQTLQLQATGGQSYEWSAMSNSPSTLNDLSCTDCPNPLFSGDSSRVYTVRIWNTDSCSVVKPISIGVSHPSEIISSTFNSVCSFSTGKIKMQNVPNNVIQFGAVNKNGDTLNTNSANTFNNLSAGDYTLFYIDKFGCSTDTVVTVEPIIDTKAAFNANPKSGTAPIQINLTNQSENATDYSWWINDVYQGNQLSGFFTDTSGTFEIELIAWKTDSICVDTAKFTVFIFDSLVASLPNVFTPNKDGINDFFNVKVNLPVSYKLSILNRWGNVVFENEGDLTKGEHKLWNGEAKSGEIVTDGTYFYKIAFGLDRESIDCELTDCEVVKQGFVQVIGK